MMILLFGAIVAGARFRWAVFSFERTIVFPTVVKIIIFLLVFGGFWVGYVISASVVFNKVEKKISSGRNVLWGLMKI